KKMGMRTSLATQNCRNRESPPRERGRGRSVTVSLVDYSNRGVAFFIPCGSRENWSRLDSVSDDYRSDWGFSLPPSRFLLSSSVDAERLYRRRLARQLARGRDQEAAGQGERGGDGDAGHEVHEASPASGSRPGDEHWRAE